MYVFVNVGTYYFCMRLAMYMHKYVHEHSYVCVVMLLQKNSCTYVDNLPIIQSRQVIVSQEAKKKHHVCQFSRLCNHYKFLKCSAAITAMNITQFITNLALLTEWNQQLKDGLNQHNHS